MFELLPYMYVYDDDYEPEKYSDILYDNTDIVFLLLGYLGVQMLAGIK